MSQLLQILGRGIQVEPAQLIWHWLDHVTQTISATQPQQAKMLNKIIDMSRQQKVSIDKSIEEFRKIYPKSYYAELAAAAGALAENRLKEAYGFLKIVISRCPRNVTALYALGHCCERLGKEIEATAFYQDCIKFKNYLQMPRQRLAAIYFKNGQIEKTIREYEMLCQEYPDELTNLLILGNLYMAANQPQNSIDTFSKAILIQPDNFCPDTDSIDTLIEAGQFESALIQIDDALEEFPDRPDLLLRRGAIFTKMDEPEQALEQYTQAISVCPDFLEANIRLGSQYMLMGNCDNAALQFNRATYVNDRIVDAYMGIAAAHKFMGNIPDALTSLSMASAVNSNSPVLLSHAIDLKFKMRPVCDTKPVNSLLNTHNKLLKIQPGNPELSYRMGCLLVCAGRFSQARELFSRAIELNPSFTCARNKLVLCHYETDERALALENLAWPSICNWENLQLHYKVALLYCDKTKFAVSLLKLKDWLKENLTSIDAAINISIVLQNLGLIDTAAASWENICNTAVGQNAL